MTARQPVELAPAGQGGKSWTQAAGGITVEVPFTTEACSLAEDNQGNHLAASQRSPGAWGRLGRGLAFAEIIHHDIEYREEGVRIGHSLASFLMGWQPTIGFGHLPYQISARQFTPSVLLKRKGIRDELEP